MPTKAKPAPEKPAEEKESKPLFKSLRRLMLASIGLVAMTMDEMEEIVDKLVERGEIAEKDGKKLVEEVKEKRKAKMAEADEQVGKHLEDILVRMKVPTKSDIDALSKKINDLSTKIEGMNKG
jgi:poly(hydroxyalkanoate) granule-associated protein